jgi:iron complex outermembrane receptor protein
MMGHDKAKSLLKIGVSALALGASGIAAAQDISSVGNLSQIENIVVTARRHEESSQVTPVTVDALSADQLAAAHITSAADVLKDVPGFTFNQSNPTQPEVFMRGMGSDIFSITADQAIGFFQDGVYLARSQAANMQVFDLERVEVVKGPQGLEFGKNVAGGAVNYIPQAPTDKPEAIVTAGYGNYNSTELQGILNGPIDSNLNGRLSVSDQNHDGYAKNTLTNHDAEWQDAFTARGQFDYRPSEDFDVLLSLDGTHNRGGGFWVNNAIPSKQDKPFINSDPRKGPNNLDPTDREDMVGASAKVTWKLGSYTLTSLTAARDAVIQNQANEGGSYINFAALPHNANGTLNFNGFNSGGINDDYYDNTKGERVTTVSEEVRLASDPSRDLSWVAGAYAQYEKGARHELENFVFAAAPTKYYNPSFAGQNYVLTSLDATTESVFGELTYHITDAISIEVGARHVEDQKSMNSFHSCQTICQSYGLLTNQAGQTVNAFDATDSKSWGATTPSANVSWLVNDNAFTYFTYSTGFKSGAWNDDNSSSTYAQAVKAYDPEHSQNFEIGAKTDWFNKHLRVNASGFLSDYSNLQTQQFVVLTPNAPGANVIANAGSAQVRGAELEVTAIPIDGLLLSANAVNQIGRITSDMFNTFKDASYISHTDNLNGTTLRRTPHVSYNLSATYTNSVSPTLDGFVNATYAYTGSYYFENDKNPQLDPDVYAKGTGQLNASLGLSSNRNNWDLTVWGKNLQNKLIPSGQIYILNSFLEWYLPPRTFGVNFTKKF